MHFVIQFKLERMNPLKAANWALILVIVGWPLSYYGAMPHQLGDPAPTITRAVDEAYQLRSFAFLTVGILCLLSSVWLSGHSFTTAKVRSIVSALAVVLPTIAVILSLVL